MTSLEELFGMARLLRHLATAGWARLPQDQAIAAVLLSGHRALEIANGCGVRARSIGRVDFGLCISRGPSVSMGPLVEVHDYDAIEAVRIIPVGALLEIVASEINRLIRAVRRKQRSPR